MVISTIGYQKWAQDPDGLIRVLSQFDLVVDVRLKPWSRMMPRFSMPSLKKHLGERYEWMPEFGNLDYRSADQVRLANFPLGKEKLAVRLAQGQTVVLLCGCANIGTCHRRLVAERLAAELGGEVQHLPLTAPVVTDPSKLDLF